MRNTIFSIILVLLLVLGFNQQSYADCSGSMNGMGGQDVNCPLPLQTTPLDPGSSPAFTTANPDTVTVPNPGGIELLVSNPLVTSSGDDTVNVNGIVRTANGVAVATGDQNDMVFVGTGADIFGSISGINTGEDNDFVSITGGEISSAGVTIDTFPGADTVEISGGTIRNTTGILLIDTNDEDDIVRISGGIFIGPFGSSGTITTGSDNDNIILSQATYNFSIIDAADGNDTIHVTTDIQDLGSLFCGVGDDDTLILSMDVPIGQVAQLTADFLAAGPNGNLVVNGILYGWNGCENRIPNFNGVVTTISLAPFTATNEIGEFHTVTATVLTDGVPDPGVLVSFNIIAGPNQGVSDDNPTDANGEATFTYASDLLGTDTIVASIEVPGFGILQSNPVTKTWILPPRNVPTLSEWGLISMAAILGIIAFIAIRRKQQTA